MFGDHGRCDAARFLCARIYDLLELPPARSRLVLTLDSLFSRLSPCLCISTDPSSLRRRICSASRSSSSVFASSSLRASTAFFSSTTYTSALSSPALTAHRWPTPPVLCTRPSTLISPLRGIASSSPTAAAGAGTSRMRSRASTRRKPRSTMPHDPASYVVERTCWGLLRLS